MSGGGAVVGYLACGDHRCVSGEHHVNLKRDTPGPPREPGPGGQQQREPGKPPQRESVTLTRPKTGGKEKPGGK